MRSFILLGAAASVAVIAASSLPARADGGSALAQAVLTSAKEKSYHTTTTDKSGAVVEGDIVNPDRWRMVDKGVEMIGVGGNTYMKRNGKWTKMAGLDLLSSMRDPVKAIAAAKGKFLIDDLGSKMMEGSVLHGYRVTNKVTKSVAFIYIDSAGRIARIDSGNSVMRMSNFGEAVTIVAPM